MYNTDKDSHDSRVPVLNNELATLKDVLAKVKTLNASPQDNGRRLLSLDTELTLAGIKENPQSLLETLVDANPKKVATVIQLLELLISEATKEKGDLIKDFEAARDALAAATRVFTEVQTNHNICVTKEQATGKVVDELKAALEKTQAFHDHWQALYGSERATLLEIIDLLKKTIQ